jgi:hypothetical protein
MKHIYSDTAAVEPDRPCFLDPPRNQCTLFENGHMHDSPLHSPARINRGSSFCAPTPIRLTESTSPPRGAAVAFTSSLELPPHTTLSNSNRPGRLASSKRRAPDEDDALSHNPGISGDSSTSCQEESEQESDENQLDAASSCGNSRVRAAPNIRLSKGFFSIGKHSSATNAELLKFREVWKRYEPSIASVYRVSNSGRTKRRKARISWNLQSKDHNLPREKQFANRIVGELNWVRSHCLTGDKILQAAPLLPAGHKLSAFDSAAAMLTARLEWMQKWKWDGSAITHAQTLAAEVGIWEGVPLCHACCAATFGWSASTIRRNMTEPQGLEPRTRKSSDKYHITYALLNDVMSRAQCMPNSSGRETKVLPYSTQEMCRDHLENLHRTANNLSAKEFSISSSTFSRVKKDYSDANDCRVNMQKYKSVARCEQCEKHDGALKHAINSKAPLAVIENARKIQRDHLDEQEQQRGMYLDYKNICLRAPHLRWLVTLDGMGSDKTSLPAYRRSSKATDKLPKLECRVVGVISYGAPIPCMAFTCHDSIQSKGANASVSTIEAILDTHWNAMDPSRENWAPIPHDVSDSIVACDSSTALGSVSTPPPPRLDQIPASGSSSSVPNSKPKAPFMWPMTLHLTFDNTGADCKNGTTFRLLGVLVAMGVFISISVSTLMVGHTHDIVDQMFGVWAARLLENDVANLEELHKLFRENYSSKIYALDELTQKFETAKKLNRHTGPKPEIADHLLKLADMLGVEPVMIAREFNIDAVAWFGGKNKATIPAISEPHVFHICMEDNVQVGVEPNGEPTFDRACVLYSRHLSRSYTDKNVKHPYTKPAGGPYSSRLVLFRAGHLPSSIPKLCPRQYVDTDGPRRCAAQHEREKNMTVEQKRLFDSRLDAIDEQFEDLMKKCEKCAELQQVLQEIGPISRLTEDEKQIDALKAANLDKQRKKAAAHTDINAHQLDPAFDRQHQHLLKPDWMGKWFERVVQTIEPYYIQRNLVAGPLQEEERLKSGRKTHPYRLPADSWQRPLVPVRCDVECLRTKGPPQPGDFVITRSRDPKYPMWVALIIGEGEEKDLERSPIVRGAAASALVEAALKAGGVSTASKHKLDEDDAELQAASKSAASSNPTRRSSKKQAVSSGRAQNQQPDVPVASSVPARKARSSTNNPRRQAGPPIGKPAKGPARKRKANASETELSAVDEGDAGSNFEPDGQAGSNSEDSDEALYQKPRNSKAAAAAAASSRAASAAASSSAGPASSSRSRSKPYKRLLDNDALEKKPAKCYRVSWYEFVKNDASIKIDVYDKQSKFNPWMATQSDVVQAEWKAVLDSYEQDQFHRLPGCVVDRLKPLSFAPYDPAAIMIECVAFEQFIIWGPREIILTNDSKIQRGTWKAVFEDLTERRDIEAGLPRRENSREADAKEDARRKSRCYTPAAVVAPPAYSGMMVE